MNRTCQKCREEKALSADFFRCSNRSLGLFDQVCLDCQSQEDQVQEAMMLAISNARSRAIRSVEREGLKAIETRLARGSSIPHSAELLEAIYQACGGVGAFAKKLWVQYHTSDPGSATRTKLLNTVVQLTIKNAEGGGSKKPIELYTEEELEAEYQQRLHEHVLTIEGKVVDAERRAS